MTAPAGWLPPPYGMPGVPPPWMVPKPPPHDVPQPYLHVMRSRTWAWWRPLLGLLMLAVVYVIAAVLATVLVVVALSRTGRDLLTGLAEEDLGDWRVLLATNASLVVAIPTVWAVWGAVHQMRIGWSSSVLGRLRWRLFLPWSALALATLGVAILLSLLFDLTGGAQAGGPISSFGWLLLVVVLTTPLQSAAEEYVFRGYLSQAIAAWFRDERTGAVVAGLISATLFSLAHAPPDFLTFLDRFAVGLAASAVVRLTGGLEAAISLHAVNNVLVFLLAGLLGESATTDGSTTGELVDVVLTVLGLAGYVALVAVRRRQLAPELLTPALDLRLPPGAPRFPVPGWGPPGWVPQPWAPQPWAPQPWAPQPYPPPPWAAPQWGPPQQAFPPQQWTPEPQWAPQQWVPQPPAPWAPDPEPSPWARDPAEPDPWRRPADGPADDPAGRPPPHA